MPRRAGLLALLLCNLHCDALLQGFGEALALAALILIALTAVVVGVYVLFVGRLIRSVRAATRPGADAGAALRMWAWALLASLTHAAVIGLTSEFGYGDGEVASKLVFAAVVPLALVVAAAALAARRGRVWPVVPTVVLCVFAGTLMHARWLLRTLDELPGRVVELAGNNPTCARLSTGQVACVGPNWQGQRGDGSRHGSEAPTLVRGIADATAIVVASDLGCALRAGHAPTCWGGDDELPAPEPRGLPWSVPHAAGAVALVASERQITWMDARGELHGWPQPPPPELTRARLLVGDDDFDGAWLCALEEAGALACWPENHREPRTVQRFAGPAVAVAVDADAELACTADEHGAVRCFDLDRGQLARELDVPGLQQLVALDDDGTFCARADRRVTCWRAMDPPRTIAGFEDIDGMFAGAGRLCGVTGSRRTCIAPGGEHESDAMLLDRDREP